MELARGFILFLLSILPKCCLYEELGRVLRSNRNQGPKRWNEIVSDHEC